MLFLLRLNPVLKCARVAKEHGYAAFAIRAGGECLGGSRVLQEYKRHGKSNECSVGEGGHDAMNVYKITG